MDAAKELYCIRCNVKLKPTQTPFSYLGYSFMTELLSCPVCGNSFVPESLAKGRMKEIEQMLETK